MMGIERFIARRGKPAIFWSDNGTNFVGAEKDIVSAVTTWKLNAPSLVVQKGIKWKFNPPASPHHGGSWERLVRSCKQVFYAILGNQRLTDEVLNTTFALVEKSLNARPLTPVSSDPSELNASTPDHFLLGQRSSNLPSLATVDDFNHRKRYRRAQAYANAIWSRWLQEYVPSLNKTTKWNIPSPEKLRTGDLVWIWESNSPRGYYPMARIVSLNYGKDSVARSANLRTQSGRCTRPLVNLVPVLDSCLGPEDVADRGNCPISEYD